ncbi:hypothetical protein HFP71_04465 [Streptomyces sp. ARC32]
MPTAILTGQPVPGSSIESELRSLGFDVHLALGAADTETLLARVPASTGSPWSTPASWATRTPCASASPTPASRSPRSRAP